MNLFSLAIKYCLELLFPPYCCYCHTDGSLLCSNCYEAILFTSTPIRIHLEKNYLTSINGACEYTPIITSLIFSMKYNQVKGVCFVLGKLLYHCAEVPKVDYITAVPMHQWKLNQRGFNQAELIAKEIAHLAGIPYLECLEKRKYTQSQMSVKIKTMRQKLSQQMYHVKNDYKEKITGKSFLIIDDVCTTGNTINECARALKIYKAKEVYGLVVTHKG